MNDVKLGALCWNQYTDWPSLLEAGKGTRPRTPSRPRRAPWSSTRSRRSPERPPLIVSLHVA